ncbi:MAG: Flp pilus assembly protein CpaB [Alphaproteobacteria bacterium]|nr:Flp pilus assembly protein CpaB [Alphaproteobacteria bacterium]MDE2336396.1 Flp pilus assembly protein CpaB [Alphaproteobacteria bacterium]
MNKTSIIIIAGGALVIALIMALAMSAMLRPKHPKSTGPEVLVASRMLAVGETLEAGDAHWEVFPAGALYSGLIQKKDQPDDKKLSIYGRPLKREIESGEPITTQALVDSAGGHNFLAASLHPGMRAVAISVRPETMAGGFISPGDRVDVILDFQLNLHGNAANFSAAVAQRYASETVLNDVLVLAVDQSDKDTSDTVKVGRTVTLEVTQKGAQILAMASSMGKLSLALRRLGEKDTSENTPNPMTTDVSVSKTIQTIYEDEARASRKKQQNAVVRVYSGNAVTNVPVRPDDAE